MSEQGAELWRQGRRAAEAAKQDQLNAALENASSDEDKQAAVQAIYGPSEFKQKAENLLGRLFFRKPKPVVSPVSAPSVTTQQGAITDPETGQTISAGQPVTVKGPEIGRAHV